MPWAGLFGPFGARIKTVHGSHLIGESYGHSVSRRTSGVSKSRSNQTRRGSPTYSLAHVASDLFGVKIVSLQTAELLGQRTHVINPLGTIECLPRLSDSTRSQVDHSAVEVRQGHERMLHSIEIRSLIKTKTQSEHALGDRLELAV
jgi:hypothetical protein